MIRAVLGKPGHGKSLYLLYCMYHFVRTGWTVATNMELTDACPFAHKVVRLDDGKFPVFQTPEPEKQCPLCFGRGTNAFSNQPCPVCQGKGKQPAIPYSAFWHYMPWGVAYVLDELDNLFDSMDFAKLAAVSRDARLYWKQHRKRGDVIVYAVQNLDNIWTRIRRMTESFVVCEWNYRSSWIMSHMPKRWSSFLRAEFSDESFNEQSVVTEGRFWYREATQLFSWYRTSQLVGDPSSYGWSKD